MSQLKCNMIKEQASLQSNFKATVIVLPLLSHGLAETSALI
jgi:hypothetical protein